MCSVAASWSLGDELGGGFLPESDDENDNETDGGFLPENDNANDDEAAKVNDADTLVPDAET